MRKNILKVIAAFTLKKAAVGDSNRTCSTDGQTLFSYEMPIARHSDHGEVYLVPLHPSMTRTTRSHIRAILSAFSTSQTDVVETEMLFRTGTLRVEGPKH